MNTIPTIESLGGKTKGELQVMFRKASEAAAATTNPRKSADARQTLVIIRLCLSLKP